MEFQKKCSLLFLAVFVTLLITNPNEKSTYVERSAHHTGRIVCDSLEHESSKNLCKGIFPISEMGLRLLFHTYTDKPRNLGICSIFISRPPGSDIYAIGIAGQFIYFIHLENQWFVYVG